MSSTRTGSLAIPCFDRINAIDTGDKIVRGSPHENQPSLFTNTSQLRRGKMSEIHNRNGFKHVRKFSVFA